MSSSGGPTDRVDRRKHPRLPVDVRMMVRVTTSAITTTLKARSVDVSESGLACRIPEELADGEAVMLEFALPLCPETFHVHAVVRNSKGSRHGFEFVKLPPEYKEKITKVLEALPTLEGETRSY